MTGIWIITLCLWGLREQYLRFKALNRHLFEPEAQKAFPQEDHMQEVRP